MAKKKYVPPEVQVLIPYDRLQELLGAAHSVEELQDEIKRRDEQIAALRGQLGEVFEVIGEIRRDIRNLE